MCSELVTWIAASGGRREPHDRELEAIGGGALVSTAALICFAFWLRASLEKVPVRPAKFIAATLLMGFGTYWVGEGIGFEWPGGMLSLLWLPLLWGLLMAGGAEFLRSRRGDATVTYGPPKVL